MTDEKYEQIMLRLLVLVPQFEEEIAEVCKSFDRVQQYPEPLL